MYVEILHKYVHQCSVAEHKGGEGEGGDML